MKFRLKDTQIKTKKLIYAHSPTSSFLRLIKHTNESQFDRFFDFDISQKIKNRIHLRSKQPHYQDKMIFNFKIMLQNKSAIIFLVNFAACLSVGKSRNV